jgi:hypothetical protein
MTTRNEGLAKLDGTRAPFFPYAKEEFSRAEMDYFVNMMRQYFIQVDRFTGSLIDNVGGAYLDSPYGRFEHDATITAAAANTAYSIPFNTSVLSNSVTVDSTSHLLVRYSGIYNLQFTAELANSNTSVPQTVSIWLSKNNVNIDNTNRLITVPIQVSGTPGYASASWNFMLPLEAEDYVEIKWSTTSTSVTLPYSAAQTGPTRPATPAITSTLTYVSRL